MVGVGWIGIGVVGWRGGWGVGCGVGIGRG